MTEDLMLYLGLDPGDEALRRQVEGMARSAKEAICRATGIDWTARQKNAAFQEAVRVSVWMGYHAVRDEAKNTQFLQAYRDSLITSLQHCAGEEELP